MLELMNAGSTQLSHAGSEGAMMLNCWEKTSPLIKELERTVNFAERKCGDLMQQLHFYKEYYEKWIQAERLNNNNNNNNNNVYQEVKKFSKPGFHEGSSSENEFEKVNEYFYKKIRNKITEMNQEISEANRKIQSKFDDYNVIQKNELTMTEPNEIQSSENDENLKEETELKDVENKLSKSEPVVSITKEESESSNNKNARASRETVKISENQSTKSVPPRNKNGRKRDALPLKKRYSSLQRYKLRSKSLPQGVRRKFGFGGFIEVFDPKLNLRNNNRSKSKTSLGRESYRSLKTFKSEGQMKTKLTEAKNGLLVKLRKNSPISARSLQLRISNFKSERKLNETTQNYLSKSIKSDSVVPKDLSKISRAMNVTTSSVGPHSTSEYVCQDVVPSSNAVKTTDIHSNLSSTNLTQLISRPNTLIPFMRQPIPFVPCSSTSKTFNLGLNVQQVLSLIKRKKHSVTLQTLVKNGMRATRSITDKMEPTVNTLFFSHTTTSHSQVTSALCPARASIEDSLSIVTDDVGCRASCALLKQTQSMRSEMGNDKKLVDFESGESKLVEAIGENKLERPEDVWVVEQPDNSSRGCKKSRSRCTCFPKNCVDYHKVLREYTGWKIPMSKTASFTADAYHSYPPAIGGSSRPKLCSVSSQANANWSLQESEGKIELTKVENDLINLSRKYSSLEEQIVQRNLDFYEANAELDAMESELSAREMKFKDIIAYYQQLILLKEKLKSLKVKNVSQQAVNQQAQYQRPKRDPLRPTPSMTLAKVLRKIQGLQDKIKLIDSP